MNQERDGGRLKILFITAWYPTRENPGSGIFVREHAKAVTLSGDEVIVIYAERSKNSIRGIYKVSDNMEEGIRTLRISYFPSPFRPVSYLIYLWSIFSVLKRLMKVGFKPDVIHAHVFSAGVPAVLLGKLYGIPVVITEHSTEFPRKSLRKGELFRARIAFTWAHTVMPVSVSLKQAIEAAGIKANFNVVPNAVDTRLFSMTEAPRRHSSFKQLLTVCLLDSSHKKGIPFLLNALAKLRAMREDWHLDIVGDGPARSEYERLARSLGIDSKITFHGLKTKYEVAEFMRQASLFVLPSLFETFSVVAAEALASGVPVLATYSGGPEEFITEEVGLLVPPGHVEALLNGLDYMLNDLEKFKPEQISRYAIERFSPDQVGGQLHRIYLKCVGKYKGSYGTAAQTRTDQ